MILCVAPHVTQRFYSLWFRLTTDFIWGKPTRLRSATEKAWGPVLPLSHETAGWTAGQALWIVFQWMDILLKAMKNVRDVLWVKSHVNILHTYKFEFESAFYKNYLEYLVLINHKFWGQQKIVDHCNGKKPPVPLETGF